MKAFVLQSENYIRATIGAKENILFFSDILTHQYTDKIKEGFFFRKSILVNITIYKPSAEITDQKYTRLRHPMLTYELIFINQKQIINCLQAEKE